VIDVPVQLGFAPEVCVITGGAGTVLTVCVQLPAELVHPPFVPLTVYVVVARGETVIVRLVAPVDQR
jgi:hypothetical protein